MDQSILDHIFKYHAPRPGQAETYQAILDKVKELAIVLNAWVPDGREKSLAITKLEEAVMWANAGIARY